MTSRPASTHRWTLRSLASVVWTVVVVAALVLLVAPDASEVRAAAALIGPAAASTSLLLVVVAKLLLAEFFGAIAASEGVVLSRRERQRTYHLSQLAKYVPGFVWQFASKGYLLSQRGATPATAGRIIVTEQVGIVGGALLVGLALIIAAGSGTPDLMSMLLPSMAGPTLQMVIPLTVVTLVGILAVVSRRRTPGLLRLRPLVQLGAAWIALSAAFAVISAPAVTVDAASLLTAGAAFPLAYVGGYLAPFAPGGIGVREALLVLLLAPLTSTEVAVALALAARAIYLVVEVALGFVLARAART